MKRKKIAVENADAFIESTATKQATTALNTRFLIGIGSISKAIRIKHIPPPFEEFGKRRRNIIYKAYCCQI